MDCIAGYILLAERLDAEGAQFCTGWNFGPPAADVRPVSWIADFLVKSWGAGASWELDEGHHPHEARMLCLDSTNATEMLGWKPKLPLPQALEWTAEWYKTSHAGANARDICVRQIDAYERLEPSSR